MRAAIGNLLLLVLPAMVHAQDRQLLRVARSEVDFVSDAPLERITASNAATRGVLDAARRSFAIQIPIRSFEGFNNPLQREHFNENYLESGHFPYGTFTGRVIEAADLSKPGKYEVRAKGTLEIHGVKQERIIPCTVVVAAEGVRVTSSFEIPLADHGINIPGMVRQKIAPMIQVKVDLLFKPEAGTR